MEQEEPSDIFFEESASQDDCLDKNDSDRTMRTLWGMESSNNELSTKIKRKQEEIKTLKEIIKKQSENLQELQMKYEEENITLKQLPKNQEIASEKYEEAQAVISSLQLKQCGINQALEYTFEIYDSTSQLIDGALMAFNVQKEAGNQRKLIYEEDVNEMNRLGENLITNMKQRIKEKSELLEIARNKLTQFNSDNETHQILETEKRIKELNAEKDVLHNVISEIERKIKNYRAECAKYEESFEAEKNNIMRRIDEAKERIRKGEESLSKSELKVEELQKTITELNENNARIERDTAEQSKVIEILKKEISDKESKIEVLTVECDKINKDLPETSGLAELLGSKSENIKKLEKDVEKLKEQIKFSEVTLKTLQATSATLNMNIADEEEELNSVNKSNCELEQKIGRVHKEIETCNLRLDANEKALEAQQLEISNEIGSITLEDKQIVDEIIRLETELNDKELAAENLTKSTKLKQIELLERKEKLAKLEEEIKQTDVYLMTEGDTYVALLELTEAELAKLKLHNDQVRSCLNDIERQKQKIELTNLELEEKYDAISKMYNKKIDVKLAEFEDLKKELSYDEEKYNDELSKINFQYYALKNEKRYYVLQLHYTNSVIKRCHAEQIIMDSYMSWIKEKAAPFLNETKPGPEHEDNIEDDVEARPGHYDWMQKSLETEDKATRFEEVTSTEPRSNASSVSSSSLDFPKEEFVITEVETSRSAKLTSYKKPRPPPPDTTNVILIDSSDSDLPRASSFVGTRKKPRITLGSSNPPALSKPQPGRQKRTVKPAAPNKDKTRKTILDFVIDST